MNLDFNKSDGLIPVIIQDNTSLQVLMLGYMNEAALEQTEREGRVTFYSRSRKALWTKGATSGNYLQVVELRADCDNDTLLILAKPAGAVCHTGSTACFGKQADKGFLYQLESIIAQKIAEDDSDSYTNQLYKRGINKVAQKVGEEAVELVIEAKDDNADLFHNEAADLLYHLLILLKLKDTNLHAVEKVLRLRNNGI